MSFFWYQRKIVVTPPTAKEGEEQQETKIQILDECFNLRKVIRAMYDPQGQFTVWMDDGHEETNSYKKPNDKGKKEEIRVRDYLMSLIVLSKEDTERFRIETDEAYRMTATPEGTVFNNYGVTLT